MLQASALKGIMQSQQQSSSESFVAPIDYDDLEERYGAHIDKVLIRENKYGANFEDLRSTVWLKLLEAKLLERFQEHMDQQIPKTLTTIQACDALGVSLEDWIDACEAYHTGRSEVWMPTPVNLAMFNIQGVAWFDQPNALFGTEEVQLVSFGEIIDGKRCWAIERSGLEVQNGIIVGGYRRENLFKGPQITPTPAYFKNYLTMAVRNHYANFCRTTKRRHKERPQNPQGEEGHMTAWEDTLVESRHSIEVTLQLSEARSFLDNVVQACLKEYGVQPGGDEESRIYAQLLRGESLLQAMKQCGFPMKVRKSVIKSMSSKSRFEAHDELG